MRIKLRRDESAMFRFYCDVLGQISGVVNNNNASPGYGMCVRNTFFATELLLQMS